MNIVTLERHNIRGLNLSVPTDASYAIAGWSGSGKSTFCEAIATSSQKQVVTLLPKADYQFLFPDLIKTDFGAFGLSGLPLVHYFRNHAVNVNPRSTVGTHTGLFRRVRARFAHEARTSSEYFSFNLPLGWCPQCKGRGSYNRVLCTACSGRRYSEAALKYRLSVGGTPLDIAAANALTAENIVACAADLELGPLERQLASNFVALGIGYLSLDRVIGTLSGGELSRLKIAERMGASSSALFILDELSIGMDHDAVETLLGRLRPLGEGNQLWFVDHSETVLRAAEKNLYFGPGSGSAGGRVIPALPPFSFSVPQKIHAAKGKLTFRNLRCRNIQVSELELPTGSLLAITGESGCGKSTLMRDCVVPAFAEAAPHARLVLIGQGRFQAITSKSTIATFMGVADFLKTFRNDKQIRCSHCGGSGLQDDSLMCNWCFGTGFDPEYYQRIVSPGVTIHDMLTKPIAEVLPALPSAHPAAKRLSFLVRLGAGYLSLSRAVRTLSTGEFQRLHLATEVGAADFAASTIFLFDEPSRGLSQNFLQDLANVLREIIQTNGSTVWMIEHNEHLLSCADHVVDFGKRRSKPVTSLSVLPYETWSKVRLNAPAAVARIRIPSAIPERTGLSFTTLPNDGAALFQKAKNDFQGGLLKELSPTARWVYGEIPGEQFEPVVAIDLEEDVLYSPRTFCFDVLDLAGRIVKLSGQPEDHLRFFDFHDRELQCKACKGTGEMATFDHATVVANENRPFWEGLLQKSVMEALRSYNYAKIRFLHRELKRSMDIDLAKAPGDMSEAERRVLWYGLWDRTFFEKQKGSYYLWRGLNHLIQKYMRSSSSPIKEQMRKTSHRICCPICNGTILFHGRPLAVKGHDIRELLSLPLKRLRALFPEIPVIAALAELLPPETRADSDLALLDRPTQVRLKLFELAERDLFGFRIVFDNLLPFITEQDPLLQKISTHNEVLICDDKSITKTRERIIEELSADGLKRTSFVWEGIGYVGVGTELSKLRKQHACAFCDGKGRFEVESPDDTVDVVVVACTSCGGRGVSERGLKSSVQGYPAKTWLFGRVSDISPEHPVSTPLGATLLGKRLTETRKIALLQLGSRPGKTASSPSPTRARNPTSGRPKTLCQATGDACANP